MRSAPATDTERTNGANDEMGIDSFHVAQCALKRLTAFLHKVQQLALCCANLACLI